MDRIVRASMVVVTVIGVLAGAGAAAAVPATAPPLVTDPASLVNTFVGTTNGGGTFPGADVPFGMVQWSPDTSAQSGYQYGDSSITGYSLDHLSGVGYHAEGDVPILPTVGSVGTDPSSSTEPLDHSQESATPGYYQLTAGGVETQLTTTTRSGMGQFTFPASTSANLQFNLTSQGTVFATSFQVISPTEVAGSLTSGDFGSKVSAQRYTLHFDMLFNRPFTASGTWTNPTLAARTAATGERAAVHPLRVPDAAASGPQPPVDGINGAYVTFNTTSSPVVLAKVGVSYVSTSNAALNRSTENAGWNFDAVRTAAHQAWDQALSQIQIGGGTQADESTFYTSLYHSLLHPNVFSDVNGQYMGFDGQVHTVAEGHAEYANYSGWDIYHNQTQLEAMLFPGQASDTVSSMLDDYAQTGLLPQWNEDNGESYEMIGDPSDAIIADAYAFGAQGFDAQQALTDMEHEADVPNNIRPGLNYYLADGYLPSNGTYGCCHADGTVSTQEEYNADDNAIAEMASALGQGSVATTFATRANNWQNVFDPATGLVQPKNLSGAFGPPGGYIEDSAQQATAELPFDLSGVVAAAGGDQAWITFLNQVTSNLGFGNEPLLDIPQEYDYAGAPYRAQQAIRQFEAQYHDTPAGLPGNDDLGAMSSWYVWSALGFYPETAGSATVAVGSPIFPLIVIHLGNGKTLTESAPAAADNAPYVQSLTVGGASWDKAYLPATVFSAGATVDWALGTTADTTWAAAPADAPPSNTDGLYPALGYLAGSDSLTVAPGSSTAVELGGQSLSPTAQQLSWTSTSSATSGSARLTTVPASGTVSVASEAKATQAVTISVPPGTPDGQYLVSFALTTASGTRLPDVVVQVTVADDGLSSLDNDTGISADTDQAAANFDRQGHSYSQQALSSAGLAPGAAVTAGALHYVWPTAAAGQPDNVSSGGTVPRVVQVLPDPGATEIGFLGSAVDGPATGTATLTYTDGTTQTVPVGLSDWTLTAGRAAPFYGNAIVAAMPYRNTTAGSSQKVTTYVFSTTAPLTAGKTLASVTLPASVSQGGSVHIFALGTDKGPLTSGN